MSFDKESSIREYTFLVTGGAGFIGSHIVDELIKKGAKKIRVLDDLSTGFLDNISPHFSNPSFEFIDGSIAKFDKCLEACQDVDYVLHQAALGSVPRSMSDPLTTHDVNANGFLNMIQAAREKNVKRMVFASSSSVYGDSKILPKKENEIGLPLSPYAVTKRSNELYASVFAANFNLEIIGLRYFNIFGPRQNPNGPYAAAIPIFIEALLNGKVPTINGDGTQSRDFTYVQNAVNANLQALFAPAEAIGNVYNIAAGNRITLLELFKTLNEELGLKVTAHHGPERKGDVKDSWASLELSKRVLNYSPQIDFKTGISKTCAWYVAQNQLKQNF